MEVDTAGGLNFHYLKPFRQVIVSKGLILTGNYFTPLVMGILVGGRKIRFL